MNIKSIGLLWAGQQSPAAAAPKHHLLLLVQLPWLMWHPAAHCTQSSQLDKDFPSWSSWISIVCLFKKGAFRKTVLAALSSFVYFWILRGQLAPVIEDTILTNAHQSCRSYLIMYKLCSPGMVTHLTSQKNLHASLNCTENYIFFQWFCTKKSSDIKGGSKPSVVLRVVKLWRFGSYTLMFAWCLGIHALQASICFDIPSGMLN